MFIEHAERLWGRQGKQVVVSAQALLSLQSEAKTLLGNAGFWDMHVHSSTEPVTTSKYFTYTSLLINAGS